MVEKKIELPIEYARNIHQVLEDHASMGFAIISQEIKDIVSEEASRNISQIPQC